jgi:integrase
MRERALVLLGLRTGLRLTSMLSLRVGDVAAGGHARDRIRVRRSTVKGRRAGFDMPLHPQAATALRDYLETLGDQSPSAYLFPGRYSSTRLSKTAGWRAIKRVFTAAGLIGAPTEIGTHTLRKTFARLIYSALDHDLVRTSYALRHASISTTVEYLSFREEEVDAAILNLF